MQNSETDTVQASPPSTTSTLLDLKSYGKEISNSEADKKPDIEKIKIEEELQKKVDDTIQRIKDTSEQ